MATRIPTLLSSASLDAGPVSPEMPTFDGRGRGMARLGESIAVLGDVAAAIHQKKVDDDAARFISRATMEFEMQASEFQRDSTINSREDFAQMTLDHLRKKQTDFISKAPNQRVAKALELHLNRSITSRYDHALGVTETNKLNGTALDLDRDLANALSSYRADATTQGGTAYAAGNLEQNADTIRGSILARYGKTSPKLANRWLDHIDREIITGTIEHDPALARKLLDESVVDETTRATLTNRIESAESANTELARTLTRQQLDDALATSMEQGLPVQFNPNQFAVFGNDAKKVEHYYSQKALSINQSIALTSKLRDKSADYIGQELSKAKSQVTTEAASIALQNARAVVTKSIEQQDKDPAGWLVQRNAEVGAAFHRLTQSPEAEKEARRDVAFDTLLKFQGSPPEGTPPEEAGRYLGLPTGAQRLLSTALAEEHAARVKQGKPSEQVAALAELEQHYGKYWPQAYSDMVNLPGDKGIPEEMRFAFLIQDPAVQKDYIGAISNVEAIRGIAEEQKSKFRAALDSNPAWKLFRQPIMGDSSQGAEELQGYYNGLLAYSYALSFRGLSPADSVKKSVDAILNTHFGFADVHGQTVAVPKWRSDKSAPWRTDPEITDIGRRLAVALREVPVEDMQTVDAYGRDIFRTAMIAPSGKERLQHVQDVVTKNGFWVSDPSGQSVTLYLKSDVFRGQPVDKHGQPFRITLDTLPAYSRNIPSIVNMGTRYIPEKAKGTYDLGQYRNRALFDNLRKASRITSLLHEPAEIETPPPKPLQAPTLLQQILGQ